MSTIFSLRQRNNQTKSMWQPSLISDDFISSDISFIFNFMLLSVTVSPLCDFMHFLKLCDCPIRKYIQETFLLAWEPRVLCSFLQKVCVGTALLTTMKQLEVWLLSIAHSNSLFITQIPFCAICNFFSITYASYILG